MKIPVINFKPYFINYYIFKNNIIILYNFIKNLKSKKNLFKKNRRLIKGSGKKPWTQKGTGRARFGDKKNPIWRGGGVTFAKYISKNKKKYKNILKQLINLSFYCNKLFIYEKKFFFLFFFLKSKNIFFWELKNNCLINNIKKIKILDFLKYEKIFITIEAYYDLINNAL